MKNTSPLFSIIMANYNNGCYISEAIESILQQAYSNWELIVVDDCSTDNSLLVCNDYKNDSRIHILQNPRNRGLGYSRWYGCIESKGELMAYLDADDKLEPNALETMVNAHIMHPEWVLIGSKYRELWNDNQLVPYAYPVGPQKGELDDYILSHPNRVVAFASFKRSAYLKTSGFDATLRQAEDKDIFLKLEEVGDVGCVGFVDESLYQYRQDNTNSLSLGSTEKIKKCAYYRSLVYLRAYYRRYVTKSVHYMRHKDEYANKIYDELIGLVRNRRHIIEIRLVKYISIYLLMNKFSKKSIKRSIKIILRKY